MASFQLPVHPKLGAKLVSTYVVKLPLFPNSGQAGSYRFVGRITTDKRACVHEWSSSRLVGQPEVVQLLAPSWESNFRIARYPSSEQHGLQPDGTIAGACSWHHRAEAYERQHHRIDSRKLRSARGRVIRRISAPALHLLPQ